jgi:hypothetical protein
MCARVLLVLMRLTLSCRPEGLVRRDLKVDWEQR